MVHDEIPKGQLDQWREQLIADTVDRGHRYIVTEWETSKGAHRFTFAVNVSTFDELPRDAVNDPSRDVYDVENESVVTEGDL